MGRTYIYRPENTCSVKNRLRGDYSGFPRFRLWICRLPCIRDARGSFKPCNRAVPAGGGAQGGDTQSARRGTHFGHPTVLDRLIQQALHQVLQPLWEPDFSEFSYGSRPGRYAHQAVEAARSYVREGKRWVVDLDLEKFFDRVNHDILMARALSMWRVATQSSSAELFSLLFFFPEHTQQDIKAILA